MNLQMITETEKQLYVYIESFNRFLYNQTKHMDEKHFCMQCLQYFSSERVLADHRETCISVNTGSGVSRRGRSKPV